MKSDVGLHFQNIRFQRIYEKFESRSGLKPAPHGAWLARISQTSPALLSCNSSPKTLLSMNSSIKHFAISLCLLCGLIQTAHAQSYPGRLSFGFDAGGNKYWGNFSDNQFWFSGDAYFRYNILDWLS